MQIIGCQLDIVWENKAQNCAKVEQLLSGAVLPDALVMLPEMFATDFSFNVAEVAEPPGGRTEQFLARMAREQRAYVLGGVAIQEDNEGSGPTRNQAVTFGPDGLLLARYSKMQLFVPGGEQEHFTPGREPAVFRWGDCLVAPFICFDLRFPEIFRMAIRRGAKVLAVIACWPEIRAAHWLPLLKARAIENQAYVAAVNCCGRDPQRTYVGQSVVFDPWGRVVAEATPGENIFSAELDLPALREYRRQFPALQSLSPDFCGEP